MARDEPAACPECGGSGWRARDADGVRRVDRCDCWRRQVTRTLLDGAGIPRRYRKCDFSSFVTYRNEELLRAVRIARGFAEQFPVVDRSLILIGPPGVGKTHLAVATLREVVLEKAVRGLYFDTRTLLAAIRSTFNPVTRTAEADVLRAVMDAELLVLDDLGAERPTDWVEETMNLVVNTRYNDDRPTIFTSNYEDVPHTDSDDKPDDERSVSLRERVGFRMHSRLREMCEFLEYSGPDYREFEFPPTEKILYQRWKSQPRRRLPRRAASRARARPKGERLDLGWSGGKAGKVGA